MGSCGAAFSRGSCLARFDKAYICWIDFADVSDRVGGFSPLLGLIFYGVVTPIGLILRISGHDPLQLKKPSGNSVWKTSVGRTDATRYLRQS